MQLKAPPVSPNFDQGWQDAMNGKPNTHASPNYCEGYAAALHAKGE